MKTFTLLVIGGALAFKAQSLVSFGTESWLTSLDLGHKLSAVVIMTINGTIVCVIFAILAMIRMQIGPANLFRLIKTRGRSK